MNIKSDSWHYALVSNITLLDETDDINLCKYIRHVLLSLMICIIGVMVIEMLLILALDPIISWALYWIKGGEILYFFSEGTLVLGTVIYIITPFVAPFFLIKKKYNKKSIINHEGIIYQAYRSYKDKFCPVIKVVE